MRYGLLALLALMSPNLFAAIAVVEGVQMPAWVEQDGMKMPLTPGTRLRNSDIVSTGDGGRAEMKLEEGGTLKLGEDAHLSLDNLAPTIGLDGRYRVALAVDQGAFRYTSSTVVQKTVTRKKLKKGSKKIVKRKTVEAHPRIVNVHLRSVNASAGGGDIWGKASDERDVVALFRGRVDVAHDDASQVSLTKAGTSVDALSGSTLSAPRTVPASDKNSWLRETGPITGRGVATRKGVWKVSIGTFRQGAEAEELMHKVTDEGYAAEMVPATVGGRAQTRLQITHFKTSGDAQVIAQRIRKEFDLDTVTVMR
jgi:hypothetical protein